MTADRITYRFSVPGAPVSTNRLFTYDSRGSGKGHAYPPAKGVAYKKLVAALATEAGLEAIPGDLRISVTYYHQHPKRRADLDNVLKALIDGLGYAFDDKQIIHLSISREHCPEAPRIEVRIECST